MAGYGVSVVVPVRDGAAHLPALLAVLADQQVAGGFEVIALDSGSQDGSRELLQASRLSPRLIDVAPLAFDHGETRNLGAREAQAPVVVFLSQDALPVGSHFLARLVAPLAGDARLAGVRARQRPRPDADAITRDRLRQGTAADATPRQVFATAAELDALPPLDRLRCCAFDNVAAAARRDVLLAHPFPRSRFGEDVAWADRVLRAGYGLAYEPLAEVVHSHPRRAGALFRRRYLEHRLLQRLFGFASVPTVGALLRAGVGAAGRDLALAWRAQDAPGEWLRAPARALAEVLGQYRGARDERLGRAYPRWA